LAASTVYYQASNIRQFGQAPNSKQKNFLKWLVARHLIFFFFFFIAIPVFSHTAFYGTFRSAAFSITISFCLSQVMRRGSGALSPATHAHSTSHSQTYTTTFIHPWAPFPDGTRTRADLAVVAERVLIFLPPPYRQPRGDIHTHPWPGRGSFL
jgi:hypothetical protein